MSTSPEDVRKNAQARYEPGRGPYSKEEDQDQVDLAWFENFASHYMIYSDPRGMLACSILRLTEEVRRARGWTQPQRNGLNVLEDYPWPRPE